MTPRPDTRGTGRDSGPEVNRFIEQFAQNMTSLGFPRMAARVFVSILIAENGRTATELTEQLEISRAAVSQSVRYLSQLGLIQRERSPGQRYDRYRVHDGMWYEMFARRDDAFLRLEADLASGIETLGQESAGAARLDETRRFFQFIRAEVPLLMDHWRQIRTEPDAATGR